VVWGNTHACCHVCAAMRAGGWLVGLLVGWTTTTSTRSVLGVVIKGLTRKELKKEER